MLQCVFWPRVHGMKLVDFLICAPRFFLFSAIYLFFTEGMDSQERLVNLFIAFSSRSIILFLACFSGSIQFKKELHIIY